MTGNKYHAAKTTLYGITFDSKAEARYYLTLKAREAKGEITDLQRQVYYELVPPLKVMENGKLRTWRSVGYVADFEFYDHVENRHRVIDVKGMKTKQYQIKRKLMLQKYGILVEEVQM